MAIEESYSSIEKLLSRVNYLSENGYTSSKVNNYSKNTIEIVHIELGKTPSSTFGLCIKIAFFAIFSVFSRECRRRFEVEKAAWKNDKCIYILECTLQKTGDVQEDKDPLQNPTRLVKSAIEAISSREEEASSSSSIDESSFDDESNNSAVEFEGIEIKDGSFSLSSEAADETSSTEEEFYDAEECSSAEA